MNDRRQEYEWLAHGGYYRITVTRDNAGWWLTVRKSDGGTGCKIGPYENSAPLVALAEVIMDGHLLIDHRDGNQPGERRFILRMRGKSD